MNDSMHINDIPNSMIYDLITRLEAKIDTLETKVDSNFARLEAKIDTLETKVDSNFARLEAKIDASVARLDAKIDSSTARLEAKIDKNTELVSELYRRGDKLELSFSRKVLLGNSALAGIVAFFVALFTGRMVVEN